MPAPMLGEARATFRRVVLGDIEVTSVLDGVVTRDGPHPIFGHDQSAQTVSAYAKARAMPATGFEHTFAPAVVNTGDTLVLFDTGLGTMGRGAGNGQLRARLPAAGYQPDDIDLVVLTHGHPDHIAGLWEGEAPAFPNARYAIGQVEYDAWLSGDAIPEQRAQNRELFLKTLPPLAERTTFLSGGDTVAPGITAVETFGHSLGHMSFMIESGGKPLLLWGDVTNHAIFSLEKPDWQVAFDDDKAQAIATRKRVLDWAATDNLAVLGFHMPFPGFGFVERASDGYRWAPESYRLKF